MNKRLWKAQEAADFLQISLRTLYNLRSAQNSGPPAIRVGGALRYDPDQLVAWAEAQTEQTAGVR